MKNRCIIFLLSIIITVTAVFVFLPKTGTGQAGQAGQANAPSQYLRIHIRANSNEESAQAVKYQVRDAVVEYLTPIVANCQTKAQATAQIQTNLSTLQAVANSVLLSQGISYGAAAIVQNECFPTRVYGEYTLPAGEYTAIVIALGEGKGDNWWCVVYPPLCFVAPTESNFIYKSKILEIIERWKANG